MTKKKPPSRKAEAPDAAPTQPPKRPPGRPTKYRPEFCQDIVDHMRQGYSIETFPALLYDKYRLMLSKDSIYEWEEVIPEFSDAIKAGRALSQKYYEDIARSGMTGNLRRVTKETPIIVDSKAVLDKDGKPVTTKEFEPATFSAAAWIFTMKNRFHWKDKVEHSGEIHNPSPVGDALLKVMADPALAAAARKIATKLSEGD